MTTSCRLFFQLTGRGPAAGAVDVYSAAIPAALMSAAGVGPHCALSWQPTLPTVADAWLFLSTIAATKLCYVLTEQVGLEKSNGRNAICVCVCVC